MKLNIEYYYFVFLYSCIAIYSAEKYVQVFESLIVFVRLINCLISVLMKFKRNYSFVFANELFLAANQIPDPVKFDSYACLRNSIEI